VHNTFPEVIIISLVQGGMNDCTTSARVARLLGFLSRGCEDLGAMKLRVILKTRRRRTERLRPLGTRAGKGDVVEQGRKAKWTI
jgi:hypothetical protein